MDPQFAPSRTLVTIGDIACTAREVITPSGAIPVGSATWTLTDMSRTEQRSPAWAIVLAVLFALCCLLGLLFLLAREERTEGRHPGSRHVEDEAFPAQRPGQLRPFPRALGQRADPRNPLPAR